MPTRSVHALLTCCLLAACTPIGDDGGATADDLHGRPARTPDLALARTPDLALAQPGDGATAAPSVTLTVEGAPDLSIDAATTRVTVGFVSGVPTQVELWRDSYPAFAIWPGGSFFTLAADGASISGNWCISRSCWLDVPGPHVLYARATYADGSSFIASVSLTVHDVSSPPPPAPGVEWTGVTAAMWAEIATQRAAFGDSNDCEARVAAIPTAGGVTLSPGEDINAALQANSVVFLSGGTYTLSSTINLDVGKKLVGVAGQAVTIDASAVSQAVWIRDGAVLANVNIRDAGDVGINFYTAAGDHGSIGALVYQTSVSRTGYSSPTCTGGVGIMVTQNAYGNCLVSAEVFDSWNALGTDGSTTSITAHGGNSDGIDLSNGAHDNTLIDFHSYRNGDDGIDMWKGGVAFLYFSAAHDNGKTTGKTLTGDGNGIKLGVGDVVHRIYKTLANDNKACGYDLNGNAQNPQLVQSTATGNPDGDYCYFTP